MSTAMKRILRTLVFELHKLEAQQVLLQDLHAYNSLLVSGDDYDTIQVLMLLPRIVFKAELVSDKQQFTIDDTLSPPSTLWNLQK